MDIKFIRERVMLVVTGKRLNWKADAVNPADWEAWDAAHRRRQGWRAGLTIWGKTNVPKSRVLLSRHWPHRLCWSWSVWVGLHRKGFDGPRRLSLLWDRARTFEVRVYGAYVRLNWQDSDWMVAGHHRDGTEPRLLWKHHLQHMPVGGTA